MGLKGTTLILGGRGMVGSAILRELQERGISNILNPTSSELDLTRQQETIDYFNKHKPDYVFVAAAKVGGIKANNERRADFIFVNLQITTNAFEAAFKSGVKKLLFLGSSCIYPKNFTQPLKEEYLLGGPLEPTNEPYAIAKIAGLKLAENFQRQYGNNFISLMPTNLYGEGDNFHPEESHVIPGLIVRMHKAIAAGEDTFTVWGSGKPRREFLYVDDLARACVFIMERKEPLPYNFLNVGTGEDIPIKDLAHIIAEAMGFKGKIIFDTSIPDGMMEKRLDISRIKNLGWSPQVSLLEGITKTVNCFKQYLTRA